MREGRRSFLDVVGTTSVRDGVRVVREHPTTSVLTGVGVAAIGLAALYAAHRRPIGAEPPRPLEPAAQHRDPMAPPIAPPRAAQPMAPPSGQPRAVWYKRGTPLRAQDAPCTPHKTLAQASEERGDAVSVCERYDHCKVGLMIAGNSGRPGGAVGGIGGRVDLSQVRDDHRTQEESVVSSWMKGECNDDENAMHELFRRTIAGMWGMVNPTGTDHRTIQGVDYTRAEPEEYGDAWVVRDATLRVPRKGTQPTRATLVFVSGPNAAAARSSTGSATRTLNRTMKEYERFREGVKYAVRAGLDAMIREGVEVALVARVSGGIYAEEKNREGLKDEFLPLIDQILDEDLGGTKRGHYFVHVLVPTPTQKIFV
jgi:hypothetical protein